MHISRMLRVTLIKIASSCAALFQLQTGIKIRGVCFRQNVLFHVNRHILECFFLIH